jgi:hypothetical protein
MQGFGRKRAGSTTVPLGWGSGLGQAGLVLIAAAAAGALTLAPLGSSTARERGPDFPEEDFGRWEHGLSRCRILGLGREEARPRPCRTLRLDQQLSGLMSVRFSGVSREGAGGGGSELRYVGILMKGSLPMRCREGRCEPQWPLRLAVTALAESGFDGSGLASGLPQTHLAKGDCLLAKGSVVCRAASADGPPWQAEARF